MCISVLRCAVTPRRVTFSGHSSHSSVMVLSVVHQQPQKLEGLLLSFTSSEACLVFQWIHFRNLTPEGFFNMQNSLKRAKSPCMIPLIFNYVIREISGCSQREKFSIRMKNKK